MPSGAQRPAPNCDSSRGGTVTIAVAPPVRTSMTCRPNRPSLSVPFTNRRLPSGDQRGVRTYRMVVARTRYSPVATFLRPIASRLPNPTCVRNASDRPSGENAGPMFEPTKVPAAPRGRPAACPPAPSGHGVDVHQADLPLVVVGVERDTKNPDDAAEILLDQHGVAVGVTIGDGLGPEAGRPGPAAQEQEVTAVGRPGGLGRVGDQRGRIGRRDLGEQDVASAGSGRRGAIEREPAAVPRQCEARREGVDWDRGAHRSP